MFAQVPERSGYPTDPLTTDSENETRVVISERKMNNNLKFTLVAIPRKTTIFYTSNMSILMKLQLYCKNMLEIQENDRFKSRKSKSLTPTSNERWPRCIVNTCIFCQCSSVFVKTRFLWQVLVSRKKSGMQFSETFGRPGTRVPDRKNTSGTRSRFFGPVQTLVNSTVAPAGPSAELPNPDNDTNF